MHARDTLDWIGILFAVLGTLLTLVGLFFTLRAAQKARAAADKAAGAAAVAGRYIRERVTIGDFVTVLDSLKAVVAQLEARHPQGALYELRYCRQKLNELRGREGLEDKREDIAMVVEDLAAFQGALEKHLWDPSLSLPDVPRVSEILHRHMDTISSWAERLRLSGAKET